MSPATTRLALSRGFWWHFNALGETTTADTDLFLRSFFCRNVRGCGEESEAVFPEFPLQTRFWSDSEPLSEELTTLVSGEQAVGPEKGSDRRWARSVLRESLAKLHGRRWSCGTCHVSENWYVESKARRDEGCSTLRFAKHVAVRFW